MKKMKTKDHPKIFLIVSASDEVVKCDGSDPEAEMLEFMADHYNDGQSYQVFSAQEVDIEYKASIKTKGCG